MEKQKKEMIFLVVFVIVSVIVLDGMYVVAPMITGFSAKTLEISEKKALIAEALQLQTDKSVIMRRYDEVKREFEAYEEKLPTEKEVPKLLDQLNEKGQESGIQFKLLENQGDSFLVGARGVQYREHLMGYHVLGGFHNIGMFINKIESFPRFVRIKSLKIFVDDDERDREKKDREPPIPQAKILVSTYTFDVSEEGMLKK